MESKYEILAKAGGYAIIEQDEKLIFINYGTNWLYTFNFVLIILLMITLINGIIQLILNNFLVGAVLCAVSLLTVFFLIMGIRSLKKNKNKPLEKLNTLIIVDLKSKELLNKKGELIAPLRLVRFGRVMQAFSSSYAIQVEWPQGSMIIARGNPFAGSSTNFIDILKKKGLMK